MLSSRKDIYAAYTAFWDTHSSVSNLFLLFFLLKKVSVCRCPQAWEMRGINNVINKRIHGRVALYLCHKIIWLFVIVTCEEDDIYDRETQQLILHCKFTGYGCSGGYKQSSYQLSGFPNGSTVLRSKISTSSKTVVAPAATLSSPAASGDTELG